MKKVFLGLSILVASQMALADVIAQAKSKNLSGFAGRYAKNCDKQHAQDLSYAIDVHSMSRLKDVKVQYASYQGTRTDYVKVRGFQAINSRDYGNYQVDFYKKIKKNGKKCNI